MANKTITVPTSGGGVVEVTGYVVILPVGDQKHRFLIHPGTNSPKAKHLTHLASGRKFGELNSAGVSFMVATGKRLTERGQAEYLVRRKVAEVGAGKVNEILNKAAELAREVTA